MVNENNSNIKRLLCISSSMNTGGAETFLMKIYRALDKSKYQMDFYVTTPDEGFYEKEIIQLGGKIFHSVPKSKKPLKSFIEIMKTVKRENYDIVMRVSSHSLSILDLIAAKFGGAKVLVYRSNNSKVSGGRLSLLLHNLFKGLSIKVPTIKIAPSTEAAEFMFGKKCMKKGYVTILKNAISIDDFVFDLKRRIKLRKELGVENKFVVGHVGRFNYQKNHNFLIDIFYEITKKQSDAVLVLVGKGELEYNIKSKINTLGLADKVIFTGVRSDIPDIMMAMDVFVFPSYFEGMPNVVIEAQATGLPCIVSDTITNEVQITNLVKFMPININPTQWVELILNSCKNIQRENMKLNFIESGYDINSVVKFFENIIFS